MEANCCGNCLTKEMHLYRAFLGMMFRQFFSFFSFWRNHCIQMVGGNYSERRVWNDRERIQPPQNFRLEEKFFYIKQYATSNLVFVFLVLTPISQQHVLHFYLFLSQEFILNSRFWFCSDRSCFYLLLNDLNVMAWFAVCILKGYNLPSWLNHRVSFIKIDFSSASILLTVSRNCFSWVEMWILFLTFQVPFFFFIQSR